MNVVNRTVMALVLLRRELEKDVLALALRGGFLVRRHVFYVATGCGARLRGRESAVELVVRRLRGLRRLRNALN
jgi:hypothetical protein